MWALAAWGGRRGWVPRGSSRQEESCCLLCVCSGKLSSAQPLEINSTAGETCGRSIFPAERALWACKCGQGARARGGPWAVLQLVEQLWSTAPWEARSCSAHYNTPWDCGDVAAAAPRSHLGCSGKPAAPPHSTHASWGLRNPLGRWWSSSCACTSLTFLVLPACFQHHYLWAGEGTSANSHNSNWKRAFSFEFLATTFSIEGPARETIFKQFYLPSLIIIDVRKQWRIVAGRSTKKGFWAVGSTRLVSLHLQTLVSKQKHFSHHSANCHLPFISFLSDERSSAKIPGNTCLDSYCNAISDWPCTSISRTTDLSCAQHGCIRRRMPSCCLPPPLLTPPIPDSTARYMKTKVHSATNWWAQHCRAFTTHIYRCLFFCF